MRRVIYTTNLIESMNARLRKVTRNRGQFPSGQAALKVLYLAVRNLEEFRRPNVGIRSSGWKQALQAFTIYFDAGSPPHENRHDHLHRRSDVPLVPMKPKGDLRRCFRFCRCWFHRGKWCLTR